MEKQQFLALGDTEIAQSVHDGGLRVAVFPINGTRRWYFLEYPPKPDIDLLAHYMEVSGQKHIDLYRMFFRYGIRTLLTPLFGPDLMERGAAYVHMAVEGLKMFVRHPSFLKFYNEFDVRVRIYGEHRKFFQDTPFAELSDLFDEITERTQNNQTNRLFLGVCAHDVVQPIADMSVQFYQEHGRVPNRDELIAQYYGEPVPPVNLFIGFDKFAAFDMPFLTTGAEDLYFTVAPSLYLTEYQLREIIYDHLYTRQVEETDYQDLGANDWALMRDFYQANIGKTQGIGDQQLRGNYWYPKPQVIIPPHFEGES